MTLIALFASTFLMVFTLGIQQLNVNNDHRLAAMVTSLFIGASQMVLFKLAPSADWQETAAFLLGGPFGIYAAMAAHPCLVRIITRRPRRNDRVEGRDAASSRRVPSHDGLCPDGGEK